MPDTPIPPGHDRPGAPRRAPGFFSSRRRAAICGLLIVLGGFSPIVVRAEEGTEPITRSLLVPLDHAEPHGARAALDYELGAPFDPAKPTVLVIADGQQFYVRKGAMAGLQKEEFGPEFNVVGIIGRGATPAFIEAARNGDGTPDWMSAWRLFRSDQWIEDIEAVRVDLLGRRGKVMLYGASGGAFLVHQHLARHGEYVSRAFTACPVDPFEVGALGLNSDRFWDEIGATDPALHEALKSALARHAEDRATLIMTLQRQNFFVPPERLQAERADLIRAVAAGDEERYARARKEYQVEEVRAFFEAKEGIPIRVREYELFFPAGALDRLRSTEAVYPDLENQRNFAAPLLALQAESRIPAPAIDRSAPHRLETEVFVLAGRWDHTVDYRTAVALAARYPRGTLFLADDDHMFASLKESGARDDLLRSSLHDGGASARLRAALAKAAPHRWTER